MTVAFPEKVGVMDARAGVCKSDRLPLWEPKKHDWSHPEPVDWCVFGVDAFWRYCKRRDCRRAYAVSERGSMLGYFNR